MKKKISILAVVFFIATLSFVFNQASASIIIELDESTMTNKVSFATDINGNTLPAYDVTFFEEVHYYQVGETFKVSVKNEDTLADIYLMMTMSGDASSDNSWWLTQTMNMTTSPPSLQTSYYNADSTGNRKRFAQVGDQKTVQVMEFYITADMLNYPVTFWAFASDPSDNNKIVGMDSKTVFLAPDLTKTFLSSSSFQLPIELVVNCIGLNDVKNFHMAQNATTLVTVSNVAGTFMVTANSGPAFVMAKLDTSNGYKVTLTSNSSSTGTYAGSTAQIVMVDIRSGSCNTNQRVTLNITLD